MKAMTDTSNAVPAAVVGHPSQQIVLFEDAAFHVEKLPLYGGVSPTATPKVPPFMAKACTRFHCSTGGWTPQQAPL